MDTQATIKAWGIGGLIALIVLILAILFWALGRIEPITAGLIAGLAIARLT